MSHFNQIHQQGEKKMSDFRTLRSFEEELVRALTRLEIECEVWRHDPARWDVWLHHRRDEAILETVIKSLACALPDWDASDITTNHGRLRCEAPYMIQLDGMLPNEINMYSRGAYRHLIAKQGYEIISFFRTEQLCECIDQNGRRLMMNGYLSEMTPFSQTCVDMYAEHLHIGPRHCDTHLPTCVRLWDKCLRNRICEFTVYIRPQSGTVCCVSSRFEMIPYMYRYSTTPPHINPPQPTL